MLISFEFVLRLLESDKSSDNTETLLTTPAAVTDELRTTTQTTTKKSKEKKPVEKLPKSDESNNNRKAKKKRKKSKEKQAKKHPNMGQISGKNRQLSGSFGTSPLVTVPVPITTVTNGLMGDDITEPTTANMNPRPTTSLPPTITTTTSISL